MPSTYRVVLSHEAGRNIEEAFHWIATDDLEAAKRWYDGLMDRLNTLSQFPLGCPIAPETRLGLVGREVLQVLHGRGFWKYRILLVVEDDRVLIAHVRHGARLYLGQNDPPE